MPLRPLFVEIPPFVRPFVISILMIFNSSGLMAQTDGQLRKANELASGGNISAAPSGDSIRGVDIRRYFSPIDLTQLQDGIYLDIRTYSQVPRKDEQPDLRWTAQLGGGQWFGAAELVEYLYDARLDNRTPDLERNKEGKLLHPNHWRAILSREDGTLFSRAQIMRTAAVPGTVRSRVHYRSGRMEQFVTRIQSAVTEDWRGSATTAITVRALESFAGADIASPFETEIWLEGSEQALAKVDHMLFWLEGKLPNTEARITPTQHLSGARSTPGGYRLRLVMKDDSIEEYSIEAACMTQRFHKFQLSRSEPLIGLQGPSVLMGAIKSATYTITPEGGETSTLSGNAYAYGFYDNAVDWTGVEPANVKVEIKYKGGATETVEGRVALPQEGKPALITEDFFWGYVDDEPQWLLHHRVPFGAWCEGIETKQLNMPGRGSQSSLAWPDFEVLEVQPFINKEHLAIAGISMDSYAGSSVSLPSVQGYTMQSPELKEISLAVTRTWENPKYKSNANDEWQTQIIGPWSQLDEISSVDYTARFSRFGSHYKSTWVSKERYSLHADGFPGLFFVPALSSLVATVHFLDGREAVTFTWNEEVQ